MAYFTPRSILEIEGTCPWMEERKDKSKYKPGLNGFHEEVEDFFVFLSPTQKEKDKRLEVFTRIKNVILQFYPMAKVDTFGSSRIGLFLPTSDIDIRVLLEDGELDIQAQRQVLNRIKDSLTARKLIVDHKTKLLDGKLCEVAVLKIKDKISTVNVDIVAKKVKGPDAAALIQSWFFKWPMAPKLFLVLKQFIVFHNLDGVYRGGLNSYSLIIMIVCFLRMTGKQQGWNMNCSPVRAKNFNLGVLLYEFLNYYGNEFDYQKSGLRISDGGSIFDKQQNQPSDVLTIEDPLEQNHNISGGTFCVENVKRGFALAAGALEKPMKLFTCFFPDIGFLGRIVRVSPVTISYRKRIVQDFTTLEIESILRSKSEFDWGCIRNWKPPQALQSTPNLIPIPAAMSSSNSKNSSKFTDTADASNCSGSNGSGDGSASNIELDFEWMSMYTPGDSDSD